MADKNILGADPYEAVSLFNYRKIIYAYPSMSISTRKVSSKVDQLSIALDDLESQLQPLLSQSLPETIISLDTLQQANLQVLLPYILNGLVVGMWNTASHWIGQAHLALCSLAHLKTRGIDPKTHPVITELVRSLYRVMRAYRIFLTYL